MSAPRVSPPGTRSGSGSRHGGSSSSKKLLEDYYHNREAILRYRHEMDRLDEEERNRPPARPPPQGPSRRREEYIHSEEEMKSAHPPHKRDLDDDAFLSSAKHRQQQQQQQQEEETEEATSQRSKRTETGDVAPSEDVTSTTKRPAGLYQGHGATRTEGSEPPPLPSRSAPQHYTSNVATTTTASNDAMLARYLQMRKAREEQQGEEREEAQAAAQATAAAQAWEGFFNYQAPPPPRRHANNDRIQNAAEASGSSLYQQDWRNDFRNNVNRFKRQQEPQRHSSASPSPKRREGRQEQQRPNGPGYADLAGASQSPQSPQRRQRAHTASSSSLSRRDKEKLARELDDMERDGSQQNGGGGAFELYRAYRGQQTNSNNDGDRERQQQQQEGNAEAQGADTAAGGGGGAAERLYYRGKQFKDAVKCHTQQLRDQIEEDRTRECRFAPKINHFSRALNKTRAAASPAPSERNKANSSLVLRCSNTAAVYNLGTQHQQRPADARDVPASSSVVEYSNVHYSDEHHAFHKRHGLDFSTANVREKLIEIQEQEDEAKRQKHAEATSSPRRSTHDEQQELEKEGEGEPGFNNDARDRGSLGAEHVGVYLYNLRQQKEHHRELLARHRDEQIEQECPFKPHTVQSPWVRQVTPRYLNDANNNNSSNVRAGAFVHGDSQQQKQKQVHDSHLQFSGAAECTFHPVINSPRRNSARRNGGGGSATPAPQHRGETRVQNRHLTPSTAAKHQQRLPWLQRQQQQQQQNNKKKQTADSVENFAEYDDNNNQQDASAAVFDAYLKTPVHQRLHSSRKLTTATPRNDTSSQQEQLFQHHQQQQQDQLSRHNAQRLTDEDLHRFQLRMADAESKRRDNMASIKGQLEEEECPFQPQLSAASRSYTPKKSLKQRNEELVQRRNERTTAAETAAAPAAADTTSGRRSADSATTSAAPEPFRPSITDAAQQRKSRPLSELVSGKRDEREQKLQRLRDEQAARELDEATFAPNVEYNDDYNNRGKLREALKDKDSYERFLEGQEVKRDQLVRKYEKERKTRETMEAAECTFQPQIGETPHYARAINATLQAAGEDPHHNAHRRCAGGDDARPAFKFN